jgi:hypothetical protein
MDVIHGGCQSSVRTFLAGSKHHYLFATDTFFRQQIPAMRADEELPLGLALEPGKQRGKSLHNFRVQGQLRLFEKERRVPFE